jgi:hypothetical protein
MLHYYVMNIAPIFCFISLGFFGKIKELHHKKQLNLNYSLELVHILLHFHTGLPKSWKHSATSAHSHHPIWWQGYLSIIGSVLGRNSLLLILALAVAFLGWEPVNHISFGFAIFNNKLFRFILN